MRTRKALIVLAVSAGLAAAAFLIPTLWFRPWFVSHLYTRIVVEVALRHPMLLTRLGLPGVDLGGDRLDDFSPAGEQRDADWLERQLWYLRSYERGGMSPSQRTSAEVLEWFLNDREEGRPFLYMDYPVNQFYGFQSELPAFMTGIHPLRGRRDAENYVRRVARFGVAFDQVLEGLRLRERRGIVPPRFVIGRVRGQLRALADSSATAHPLYTSLVERLERLARTSPRSALRDEDQRRLLARLEREIRTVVIPAYRRLDDYLAALEPRAPGTDGVWALPNGDRYYAHLLRSYTTTDLNAEQIHALGASEVARIQGEMHAILSAQGMDARDLGAALRRLGHDPRFLYPAGDSGRTRMLADYRAILEDADRRLDPLFDLRPRARLQVQPVPEFKQAGAGTAYYEPGSMDGTRPGVFYANLGDPTQEPRWAMRTLAYHEGIPGHHLQISIALELKGLPLFRRVIPFIAYVEGWALYAERLALEQGFETDPFDRLGALDAELLRAARLVVDTGIHRRHWTREQGIDYLLRNTGLSDSTAVAEVERYIVLPGQACAYKVGELEIRRLREHARERLGDRFDLRAFHRVVLGNGALPLTILDGLVEDWVRSQEGAPSAERRGAPRS